MGTSTRTQSQRNPTQQRGADVHALRGGKARSRNQLKSDRDDTMSVKGAAQLDQFGSRHNKDDVKLHQRALRSPAARHDLAFRESSQDLQPNRGGHNKLPGRRRRKSGSPAEK